MLRGFSVSQGYLAVFMNFPFILDLALGLIFTYLTLSLLASEIQEIITALLQWRAEHLKRSIEVLLAGNNEESEAAARNFADALYESPWIRGLNQEAKGKVARSFRGITHGLGQAYRTVTGTRNVFGSRTSGPSYIPPEAFANSLMDRLQLGAAGQLLVETRLQQFVHEQVLLPVNHVLNDLRASTANEFLLNNELRQLEQAANQILTDFYEKRVNLAETLDRVSDRLGEFAEVARQVLPENHRLSDTFLRRLDIICRTLASNPTEKSVLLKKLQPTMAELIGIFEDGSACCKEFASLANRGNPRARALLGQIKGQVITPALQSAMITIANKVEATAEGAENRVDEFSRELEKWFDRGMERATGVYKRNAKAVGLLIGVAIAVSMNADTFNIATQLATDSAIRSTITQAATQAAGTVDATNPALLQQELNTLQAAVNTSLNQIPFPIGYGPIVLAQQAAGEANWPIPFLPRRFLGWIVSGLAISMGASFWFDLLKRVVNVRASGGKEGQNADPQQR
jgi:regulator of replication initiation timing